MLRSLRYRNYRLFFIGQMISLIGTWMTTTATSWLVYRLTGSAALLGLVAFAGQFPSFLLAPPAGILVDRWDQRRLLIATQILLMLQSLALAALTLTGRINMPAILILSAVNGAIMAFDMPCRQAFVIPMIEGKENLGNAIALNSSMVHAARLIGPPIAGLIIAVSGEGRCFLIDGLSYLAVIAALLAMNIRTHPRRADSRVGAWEQLREGWSYVFGSLPIRSIIALLALVSLVGFPYTVLIPVFAGNILHGGPHTLGLLMAAAGCGALAGALWLASRRSAPDPGTVLPTSTAIFGAGLVLFSLSRSVWLSAALLVPTGAGLMIQIAASNTILQFIVDDDKRGRVMSVFMMSFLGAAPVGSLLAGSLADRVGAPRAVLMGGVGCLLCALWFLRRLPAVREAVQPVYAKLGLSPQFTGS